MPRVAAGEAPVVKTFVPAPTPTANAWNVRKEPRPTSTPQTRGSVSVDDTIDYALNALDKLFGVLSDLDAESECFNARKVASCKPTLSRCKENSTEQKAFGASVISSLTSTSYNVKSKGTPEKMTRTPLSKGERITPSQNSPPCGNMRLLSLVCLNDQKRSPCHRP